MMSSRKPRRSFAAPLILTVAALPGCIAAGSKPANSTTTAPESRDHRGSEPDPVTMSNPPPPDTSKDRSWTIELQQDGSCRATADDGRQSSVACPDGISAGSAMSMWANAGSTECFVSYDSPSCPAGAICNPPPPKVSSCPQ